MISTDYMYASSAFQSESIENEYLTQMDVTEKEIVEKEENEIQNADQKEQRKAGILTSVIMWTVSTVLFSSRAFEMGYKGWHFAKETVPYIGGCTVGAYGLGKFVTQDIEIRKKIGLRRADRLDEKIRNIVEKISNEGKILDQKEIKELQKAQIFFSNRLFNYKSTRSKKSGDTHIMYQSNQIVYQPNKV